MHRTPIRKIRDQSPALKVKPLEVLDIIARTGCTDAMAAKAAGVCPSTVGNWRRDPTYHNLYASLRDIPDISIDLDRPETSPTLQENALYVLELIEDTGCSDREAADIVGIYRISEWKRHPEFKAMYDKAREISTAKLEAEARRRALNQSDKLLMFLLTNYAPDKYKNRQEVNTNITADLAQRVHAARGRASITQEPDDGENESGRS